MNGLLPRYSDLDGSLIKCISCGNFMSFVNGYATCCNCQTKHVTNDKSPVTGGSSEFTIPLIFAIAQSLRNLEELVGQESESYLIGTGIDPSAKISVNGGSLTILQEVEVDAKQIKWHHFLPHWENVKMMEYTPICYIDVEDSSVTFRVVGNQYVPKIKSLSDTISKQLRSHFHVTLFSE